MLTNLCLVSDVRTVLDLKPTVDVPLIARYVFAASALFERETNRVFRPTLYSERRNGTGTEILVLKRYPFIEWESLEFADEATLDMTKVFVDEHTVYIRDRVFPKGIQNILAAYWAGFGVRITDELTITSSTVTLTQPDWYYTGVSVADEAGELMTEVGENPESGQYSISELGVYSFSSDDEGTDVSVTYWYKDIPADVQQAVVEIACSRYRRKGHIDQESQGTAGQVIQFSKTDVPSEVKMQIDNYMMRGHIA